MKKPRGKNPAKTSKMYFIYAIYHKASKRVYIHYIPQRDVAKTYQHHFSLKDDYTKKLFLSSSKDDPGPKMYIIDSFGGIPSYAFTMQLIWIRYVLSNGLTCINSANEIQCSEDIYGITSNYFMQILNKDFGKVFSAEEEITPEKLAEYVTNEVSDGDRAIDIGCTITFKSKLAWRKIMHKHAKRFGIPMSSFLTQVGVVGSVITVDYSIVKEHTQVLSQYQQELQSVLKLLIAQGKIDDETVKKILDIVYDTCESEKDFLQAFIEEESTRKEKIFEHIYTKLFGGETENDL